MPDNTEQPTAEGLNRDRLETSWGRRVTGRTVARSAWRVAVRQCLCVALAVLLTGGSVHASQLVAHMYAALQLKESAPAEIKALLDRELDAYLAGATGPDLAYTTHYVQLGVATHLGVEHHPPGTESHRVRTGRLVMNLLAQARTDREKAFALGWLTHYCVDSRIHPLVNRFGGYFESDPVRHKHLEMVECELAFRRAEALKCDTSRFVVNPQAVPAELVKRAFAMTYPIPLLCDNCGGQGTVIDESGQHQRCPVCQNSLAYVSLDKDSPAYSLYAFVQVEDLLGRFDRDLLANADNLRILTQAILNVHRADDSDLNAWERLFARGEFELAVLGPPPTPHEFDQLMEPLTIENAEIAVGPSGTNELRIDYRINDLAIYAVFCRVWDAEITAAVEMAKGYLGTWMADPTQLEIADINLDIGPVPFDDKDPAQVWPGNPNIKELWLEAHLETPSGTPVPLRFQTSDGEVVAHEGWIPCAVAELEAGLVYDWQRHLWQAWGERSQLLTPQTPPEKVWKSRAGHGRIWIPLAGDSSVPSKINLRLSMRDWVSEEPFGIEASWPATGLSVEIRRSSDGHNPSLNLRARQQPPGQAFDTAIVTDHLIRGTLAGQVRYQHFIGFGRGKRAGLLEMLNGPDPFALADMEFTGIPPGTHRVHVDIVTADGLSGSSEFDFTVKAADTTEYNRRMEAVNAALNDPEVTLDRLLWAHEKRFLHSYYFRCTSPLELLPMVDAWSDLAKSLLDQPPRRGQQTSAEQLYLDEVAGVFEAYADIGGLVAYERVKSLLSEVEPLLTGEDLQRLKSAERIYRQLRHLALASANDVAAGVKFQTQINEIAKRRDEFGSWLSYSVEEIELKGLPRLEALEFPDLAPAATQVIPAEVRSDRND